MRVNKKILLLGIVTILIILINTQVVFGERANNLGAELRIYTNPEDGKLYIENIGNEDAHNVEWSITTSAPIIVIGSEKTGNIIVLPPNEPKLIYPGIILGLGPATRTISASAENADTYEKVEEGFLFLFYFISS
jgi:hypothetical protein